MSGNNTRPMYELIQNDIISKIQSGAYAEGERVPSEQELIHTWKVSRTTAAKALTELSLNGYIHRIQGKGSFVNPLGSHLSPRKYLNLPAVNEGAPKFPRKAGVIIPNYYDYHSGSIIRGIMDTLSFPSYFVTIAHGSNRQEEEHALNYFWESGYCGILLFPVDFEFYSDIILQMTLNKYPLVLMDRVFPGIHCMSVTCDNHKCCELGISHLIALGHKKIAFIAYTSCREQVTRLRMDSYLTIMASHGLPAIPFENFFLSDQATSMQENFLRQVRQKAITAAIASNSNAALELYRLCARDGIRIPEDLSVLCFDHPNFFRSPSGNFFTYLEQNSFEMGREAALLLHQVLSGEKNTDREQVVLQPGLMVNESTRALEEE